MKFHNLNQDIKALEAEGVDKDTSTASFITLARQFESTMQECNSAEKDIITSLSIAISMDLIDDQIEQMENEK